MAYAMTRAISKTGTLGVMDAQGTTEHDIQRKALVLPGLVPLIVVGAMLLLDRLGVQLNPHGGAAYLLLLVFAWGAIAAIVECVLVPKAIAQLSRSPALRTSENVLAIGFGAAFVIFVAMYATIGVINS